MSPKNVYEFGGKNDISSSWHILCRNYLMPKNWVIFVCQTNLFCSKLFTLLKYNFYLKDLFPFLDSHNHFGAINISGDSLLYSLCPCGAGQNIQEGPRKNRWTIGCRLPPLFSPEIVYAVLVSQKPLAQMQLDLFKHG